MHTDCGNTPTEHGPKPYVANVQQLATQNHTFRTTLWTGCHAQMTLMCIPVQSDIGLEIHEDTDQILQVIQGIALVRMGKDKNRMGFQREVCRGDTIFIPAGTWHNIINTGRIPLKLSSIYAPPHHPAGTIHRTKEDAEKATY